MLRMIIVVSLLVFVGCDSSAKHERAADTEVTANSVQSPPPVEDNLPAWELIDSNEWYDIFELKLTDRESFISTAFHKTDAQLGIGVSLSVAVLADDRGFKYFRFNDASLTEEQAKMLEPLLPEGRVLETTTMAEFLAVKPEQSESYVFDAGFMTQERRNKK